VLPMSPEEITLHFVPHRSTFHLLIIHVQTWDVVNTVLCFHTLCLVLWLQYAILSDHCLYFLITDYWFTTFSTSHHPPYLNSEYLSVLRKSHVTWWKFWQTSSNFMNVRATKDGFISLVDQHLVTIT
jgi:hypothetical protein